MFFPPVRRPAVRLSILALLGFVVVLAGCAESPDRPSRLNAIGRWEDRRLAPQDSLVAMLADPDAHVRLAAVRAAGLIGRDDVLPRMLDLLEDPSLTVRRQTCFSLGILADTLAVPALTTAATDPRPGVRLAALRGLAHVPNRGEALLVAATGEDAKEAAAAWDGLRNQADRVPRVDLVKAIQAGLTHPATDVQWRVLRCAERAPDSTLVAMATPFVRSSDDQVRVHAYRTLARLGGAEARSAVLGGTEIHGFRGRRADRLAIAACRALGALATDAPPEQMPVVAAYLIERSGAGSAHVAMAALDAMTAAVAERPLPDEAAIQESLLPVWRIRMARAARDRLDRPDAGVRTAAVTAYAAVRGRGALPELEPRMLPESSAHVAAALARAIGSISPAPETALSPIIGPLMLDDPLPDYPTPGPWLRHGLVAAAALDALDANEATDPQRFWQILVDMKTRATMPGATDHEQVLAATSLGHLGRFRDDPSLRSALRGDGDRAGPWRSDLRLAALGCVQEMLATPDSTWVVGDLARSEAREFVQASFDDPDVRIRQAARECAEATDLLPDNLVPTAASLRATLPAVVRAKAQPPVSTPFAAARVRCTTGRGGFVIDLDGKIAPNTSAMFLDLVAEGFYEGLTFHRVVPDFVVQGGDPTGTGWGGPGYTIRSEWSDLPYRRGMVGIAHSGKDSGGCQFFVTLSEQPHLMGRYTIFGEVGEGMEVLDAMQPGDTFSLTVEP